MNIFDGLDTIVKTDHRMAGHTWYGLGGPAQYFIGPYTVEQLQQVVERCNDNDIRMYVIGFGSILLIGDQGVKGAVIQLRQEFFRQTEFTDDTLTAWAGAELGELVLTCVKKGFSGLETLVGIPGSIGGAVRMNSGGRFGDIGGAIESVTLMDSRGQVFEKSKPELAFDYRCSNITAKFILNARMKLSPDDPEQIMRTVQETWIYKKNNQPLNTRNCGCVFKNPPGASAGALIDRAGLKGLRIGGAQVSEKHANFIVAQKGCTSADVLRLMDVIKERVKEQFNVDLEPELEIWK